MIRVIRKKNYEEMSLQAATLIGAQILLKPDAVLGLPAGRTPVGTYEELIRMNRDGRLDFSKVRTFNLDEYVGLAPGNVHSFRYFMDSVLFASINIDPANTFVPDGCADDQAQACMDFDSLINGFGGIDLQLLGIGQNGHIGFNEPNDTFIAGTHVVDLSEDTRRANSSMFSDPDDMPRSAVTMGMGAIMHARRIVLIANGAAKSNALRAAIEGPVTPRVPASILQLHPDVTVICDEEALG